MVIDRNALANNDVYFKRSYANVELCRLSERDRVKVRPYGFNYACSTDSQVRSLLFAKQLVSFEWMNTAHRQGPLRSMRRLLGHPVRWLNGKPIEVTASSPLPYMDFEVGAAAEAKRAVIFLTRLWRPSDEPGVDSDRRRQLNEARIELIRTLRRRLGQRFLGGVERDPYSEQECPDCIIDSATIKTSYVRFMKDHLIGVATTGLHGSVGWKLAEYIAAARCIVSEPIRPEGSLGFAEGTHYLSFHAAESCADACLRLLDDPTLAHKMRVANEDYYQRELRPPAMILKRLTRAMAVDQE